MIKWIVEQWDWMVYRAAQRSIRRMFERRAGFAYLFELQIRDWRDEHPIPESLERSTESFHEAMKQASKRAAMNNCPSCNLFHAPGMTCEVALQVFEVKDGRRGDAED